jgi:2-keto-4-pentenoate hydratase/2-oxohepta-3-ene-1,7-dioic acid hydratase in catechol pathway
MRFGTLGDRLVLVRDQAAVDVAEASGGRLPADPVSALDQWLELRSWAESPGEVDWSAAQPVTDDMLGPPVLLPRQVFAIGLNYRTHAAESGLALPAEPMIFTKFPACVTGPVTEVTLPASTVDWEVELVVVVGTGGYRISREFAWDAVAGLTVGQDLSERALQMRSKPPQFSIAKSYPGFGPTGPVAVTPDELADPDDLALQCSLDGEVVQSDRTSSMIFGISELVAYISGICPLLPGDLIFTGTPAGVGNGRTPPRYLRPGQELVTSIEGIGELRQRFHG